jgi:hypothetical protein
LFRLIGMHFSGSAFLKRRSFDEKEFLEHGICMVWIGIRHMGQALLTFMVYTLHLSCVVFFV